ncbi:hypothetical protein VTI74DRAFT_2424 [Chaetomium olivicolor]
MPPPIMFLELKLYNPEPNEPAVTEADYELYAEMGRLEELVEMDPNESLSAVDIRFANEVRRYRKQDLIDGWPYFRKLLDEQWGFACGRDIFKFHWPGGAQICDVDLLMDWIGTERSKFSFKPAKQAAARL